MPRNRANCRQELSPEHTEKLKLSNRANGAFCPPRIAEPPLLPMETLPLVPEGDPFYEHDTEGPDDMPAHIKAALTATSVSIPVVEGRLGLGTWQGIYLWEHRRRGSEREVLALQTVWWEREPFAQKDFTAYPDAMRFAAADPGVKYCRTASRSFGQSILSAIPSTGGSTGQS